MQIEAHSLSGLLVGANAGVSERRLGVPTSRSSVPARVFPFLRTLGYVEAGSCHVLNIG